MIKFSALAMYAKAVPFLGLDLKTRAKQLDMDHVYIRYLDLLWGYVFISPMLYCLYLKGTCVMRFRIFLIRLGLMKKPEPEDIESLVATLCLEQSQVINYVARTKKDSKLGNVAGFFFADFPYVDDDLNFRVADLFAVDIDLDTKKFVKAKLDDIDLSAKETLILLSFNTVFAQHVKIHAMARGLVQLFLGL